MVEEELAGVASGAALVVHVAAVSMGGRHYGVAALVAGERYMTGALEGATLHWSCARSAGLGWDPPPPGWHTVPARSFPAGASARCKMRSVQS